MIQFFLSQSPVLQALLAGCFTWGITAAGASLVFLVRTVNQRLLDGMMGFAAGVMIAASVWSLLIPSIGMAEEAGGFPWVPAATGFAAGWIFLWVLDLGIPHLHIGLPVEKAEGPKSSFHRTTLLVIAITLHNIPEGLAIGVAFGAVAAGLPTAALAGAIALTIGIGIQNFPEGLAISMPLRREGMSKLKSFWYGQLLGSCGTSRSSGRSSGGAYCAASSPVRTRVCGRRNVLRGGRGGDPRIPAERKRRICDSRVSYRISGNDDPGCCTWIARWSVIFFR